MPFRYRYLRDKDGGCPVMAVFDDIHQYVAGGLVDCRQSEVIEYEQPAAGYFLQQLMVISLQLCQPCRIEEPGGVVILGSVEHLAGLHPDALSQEAFARPGGTCQYDVFPARDEAQGEYPLEGVFIKVPRGEVIDVSGGSRLPEPGALDKA